MENILALNNKLYSNNNTLLEIINKLESIVNDLNNNKQIDDIIKQIKNIINIVNNIITENKNSLNLFQKDPNKIFDELKNNINNNKTEIYPNGNKYIGEFKNGMKDGKEYYIGKMVQDMKEIGEIINKKEREYCIGMMEIDMKENLEMVK